MREFAGDSKQNPDASVDYSAIGSEKLGLDDILAMQNEMDTSQANLNQSGDFGGVGNRSFDHVNNSILEEDYHSYSVSRLNTFVETDNRKVFNSEEEDTEALVDGIVSSEQKSIPGKTFAKSEKDHQLDKE